MSKNSILLKSKSNELINLLTELEGETLDRSEKSKIAYLIGRVLVHTSITLDQLSEGIKHKKMREKSLPKDGCSF